MAAGLEVSIEGELASGRAGDAVHDPGLLVLADPLLEEVRLALQRDVLHEVKRVLRAVDLWMETWISRRAEHTSTLDSLDLPEMAPTVAS